MDAEHLYQKSEKFIKELLFEKLPPDRRIFLFGSRATGRAGFSSDLDIGIIADKVDEKILIEIKEMIEESFVPFKVDLVDFTSVDAEFKQKALEQVIKWKLNWINSLLLYQNFSSKQRA